MNASTAQVRTQEVFHIAFVKNFTVVLLGIVINCINGSLVFCFFSNQVFYHNPRYILYIHMVINDMIQLSAAISLHVLTYIFPLMNVSICTVLVLIAIFTSINTPLNLAGMAVERYIAICEPLRHSQICTVRRTYTLIALIWCVGAVPGLSDLVIVLVTRPLSFFSSNILCYSLNIFNSPYQKVKTEVTQAVYMVCVWLTLIYTYLRVLFAAKAATTDTASARKARNTILLHGAQLLLCMLSYVSPTVEISLLSFIPQYYAHILFLSFLITHILPRLLSPLIYGVRDEKFRKYMKTYLLCRKVTVKVRPAKEPLSQMTSNFVDQSIFVGTANGILI
ncbi:odorant receptor 131-2-like [Amia ocellicauda]|uniref:odorant receptor 131-2-like n=1 Tax=Amia ocellicauda TaxID=2972642 RepID=UPI0034640A08